VQNFRLGLASYEQAALTRDFEASARLADLYEGNQFAPADGIKAYAWALVAMQLAPRNAEPSAQPDAAQLKRRREDEAKKAAIALKLEKLPSRLSLADLIAAQDLARSILLRMPMEKEYVERILLKAK
jgi:hypothetical protein